MKKFTKSLLTLVLLVLAVGGAKAQDVETEVSADMFHTWQGYDADAVITGDADVEINYGVALEGGNVVCGTGSVFNTVYADFTGGSKLVFEGTKDLVLRVMFNRQADNTYIEKNPKLDENGKAELDLTAYSYFHLNAIKINWGGSGTVTTVKLVKPSDPYEVPKALLKAALDKAKLQNSFAKTTESWNALQNAITAGETEYADPTSAEALGNATTAIENAIAGFEYQDGYTALTKEMANANVDYVLNSNTGLPFGTSTVDMNVYAELNEFDQFVVLSAAGEPRFCMNRLTADGQIGVDLENSKMIDINPNNEFTWATEKYQTIDEKKYTLDLKKIAADWNGLARLNCIKGAHYGNVTVTDMLLYRTITVGETGYATFGSASKNTKVNGVKAYAAIYNNVTGKVALTEVTNVPAGKGVIIEAAEGSYKPTFDVAPEDIASDLKVSDGTVTGDGSIYVLNSVGGKVGFYPLKSGNKLEAGKAYLQIAGSARGFIGFEGATGINEVNVNKAAAKTGKIYNLNGQIVSKPSKGLFIVDGKVVSF